MYQTNIGVLKSTLKIHVQISKSSFHDFLQELIETASLPKSNRFETHQLSKSTLDSLGKQKQKKIIFFEAIQQG